VAADSFVQLLPAYNAPGFDFRSEAEPLEDAIMSLDAMNRRTFLETATTVTAATLLASRLGWAAGDHKIEKIGVQLYTVRDQMKADFDGTLAKVAQIGYKEVEFAGYFGRTGQQVRAALDKNSLSAPSTHVQYDELDEKFPSVIETSQAIGLHYIVCPWIPEELRKSPDIWKQAGAKFNHAGEQSKKAGIQFAYHNHWFEFLAVNGKLPYDELLKECDANLVKMELDLCWITVAGADPIKYFDRYPGRFPLVHVKDMKKLPQVSTAGGQDFGDTMKDMTAVGSGIIDWKKIFAHSEKAGIKHYIVEHDKPENPFESITQSYEYLEKLRF
jgi:sugar phosphate isomerase/epimerase